MDLSSHLLAIEYVIWEFCRKNIFLDMVSYFVAAIDQEIRVLRNSCLCYSCLHKVCQLGISFIWSNYVIYVPFSTCLEKKKIMSREEKLIVCKRVIISSIFPSPKILIYSTMCESMNTFNLFAFNNKLLHNLLDKTSQLQIKIC